MSYKKVVDISTFDKHVDFAKLKKQVSGVIIRAGFATEVDEYFVEHIKGSNKAGIPTGIYWFSYACNRDEAIQEARKCIEVIKPYKVGLPVFFDWEYDSDRYAKEKGYKISRSTLNAMAEAFCNTIQYAGYVAGIYFNKDFRENRYYQTTLNKYIQWYAYYNSVIDDSYGIDLWQYTSSAEVDGIPEKSEDMSYVLNEKIIDYSLSEKPSEKPGSVNKEWKKDLQRALNKSYDLNLPVDGYIGVKTLSAIRYHYLRYKTPTIKNDHVRWFQKALKAIGYEIDVDGSFGPHTRFCVIQLQQKSGLAIDGYAGQQTHVEILKELEEV